MSELPKALRERAQDSISQLRAAVSQYKNVCYANSLGAESMVLTDLIWGSVPDIDIFTLDTGRLYPETYDLIERVQRRYGRALKIYYPERREVEGWVDERCCDGRECACMGMSVTPCWCPECWAKWEAESKARAGDYAFGGYYTNETEGVKT